MAIANLDVEKMAYALLYYSPNTDIDTGQDSQGGDTLE